MAEMRAARALRTACPCWQARELVKLRERDADVLVVGGHYLYSNSSIQTLGPQHGGYGGVVRSIQKVATLFGLGAAMPWPTLSFWPRSSFDSVTSPKWQLDTGLRTIPFHPAPQSLCRSTPLIAGGLAWPRRGSPKTQANRVVLA